ncbi:hypothetical protein M2401_004571 [Pseudomonas sp. JUb42]|uniref:hypothetical protein n=1 Tax=Pseudomonas sp. JUb42 TaxID=2940611 RepID=UPI002169EA42|nr:hypothetical protein [Pseudomonas sp. JUb42]MCS3470813.1 hypothetical protein [Pseudomonas sp. JUb42]
MKPLRCKLLCLLVGALSLGEAQASAHIWPVDMPPQKFASFSACLAVLQQQDRDDRQNLASSPQRLDSGAIVETNLQGPGLRRTGKHSAEYQATIGWRTRMKVGDHMEANYTYETRDLRCIKSTLHSRPSGGAEPGMPE